MQNVSFHHNQYYIVVVLQKLVILLTGAVVFSACNTQTAPKAKTADYFQTPPPDMVFVPGNGSVPSFYMGVSEETNLNYNLYLKWLDTVFSDYSFVKDWATPKNREWDTNTLLNDPLYNQYFTHPAYAYYPVVGVNWLQAMEYLSWKGDRLNEAILYETEIFDEKDISLQGHQYNFNLEAYLNDQYDFKLKKLIDKPLALYDVRGVDGISTYTRNRLASLNTGLLFPAMRLPTEAEWEVAMANTPASINQFKNPLPFGNDYYLLKWDKAYNWGFKSSITSNTNAPANGIALRTDEGGVTSNWLLDIFQPEPQLKTMAGALPDNGFRVMDKTEYSDGDGYLQEKDFMGRFPFIYYGFNRMGNGDMYQRCTPLSYKNVSDSNIYVYIDLDTNAVDTAKYLVSGQGNYKRYFLKGFKDPYNRFRWNELFHNENGFFYTIPVKYLDSKKIAMFFNNAQNRVVKNKDLRLSISQNESRLYVGFRAAMANGGYPLVNKKYKVRWK
jgi:formylglycine-generating enzyme required for sulfatase activity